ncbi:hypothetical protein BRADI_3g31677v3, partial [Brachypodium distachyon]
MKKVEKEIPHPILQAATDGDLRLVKEMAAAVEDDIIKANALCAAARKDRWEVCRLLVEHLHWDVNKPGDEDATAKYLLAQGADPKITGRLGSPLHLATMNGQCEMVKLLISKGADIDAFHDVHGAPLHVASRLDQVGPMKTLLAHEADPNKVLNLETTPLSLAIKNRSLECVKLLIK